MSDQQQEAINTTTTSASTPAKLQVPPIDTNNNNNAADGEDGDKENNDADDDELTKECAICYETMGKQGSVKLPCSHKYCITCLESWRSKYDIRSTRTCPECRSRIPPSREMVW